MRYVMMNAYYPGVEIAGQRLVVHIDVCISKKG
jgi:hypothetical protein